MTNRTGYPAAASRGTRPGLDAEAYGFGTPSPNTCTHTGWTDERTELLKKLWQDGLSGSQVAQQLGGVTRNSVIGKVHRLGLTGRATPSKPARLPKPARRMMPRAIPAIVFEPPPGVPDDIAGGFTLIQLGADMCRWPIGDPKARGFGFCGSATAEGHPYCRSHEQVAYARDPAKKTPSANELARSLRRYA